MFYLEVLYPKRGVFIKVNPSVRTYMRHLVLNNNTYTRYIMYCTLF